MLDLYAYTGGFGLAAAGAGAKSVLAVDRSQAGAATWPRQARRLRAWPSRCSVERREAFAALDGRREAKSRFGMVIADPPAFVGAKKELKPGLRAIASSPARPRGWSRRRAFSPSPAARTTSPPDAFADEVRRGLRDAGRSGRLIRQSGAGPDRASHPFLAESAYLKFLVYALT